MSVSGSSIQSQYAHGSLLEAIETALAAANHSPENLSAEALAPVDGFHIRGRQATRALIETLRLPEEPAVLDVGCGIGGTARYLADEHGAHVVGVDISEEYCDVARELTRRVQLDDQTTFRQGDALDLPVDRGRFDLVVSEHVQMNVKDKQRYVGEIARVLKPGGLLAFHEIFAGPEDERHFPVPWADAPTISFLSTPDTFREIAKSARLEVLDWVDCTRESQEWFDEMLEMVKRDGRPPLGSHLLMGAQAKEKMKNVARNLKENRIAIGAGHMRKSA